MSKSEEEQKKSEIKITSQREERAVVRTDDQVKSERNTKRGGGK